MAWKRVRFMLAGKRVRFEGR
eukprot:COSAG04_NODE_32040_length_253_cov_0.948052_1_plen_20_part_10